MTKDVLSWAIDEIRIERLRQDDQWGIQDHEDGYWYAILGEEFGEAGTCICEKFYELTNNETINRASEQNLKKELIQIAAVCVAWLESINRREATETHEPS